MRRLLLLFSFLIASVSAFSQNTYYSQGSGDFSVVVWDTNAGGGGATATFPADYDGTNNNHTFIVQDGHTVSLDVNIDVGQLAVGGGASGVFNIKNGAKTIVINGNVTILSGASFNIQNDNGDTHSLTFYGDLTIAGTFDLTNGTSVGDLVIDGTSTTVISGTGTNNFNNVIFQGGNNRIVTSNLNIDGSLTIDANNTELITSSNHTVAGDFTISNLAKLTESGGYIHFDGLAQTLNFTGGTAIFYQPRFGGTGTKTIVGDLIATGLTYVFQNAKITSTDSNHRLQGMIVYNAAADATDFIKTTTATVTFTGGTIYYDDPTNIAENGTVRLGTTDVIIDGNNWIQTGDNLIVDGDVTLESGYLVINGNGTDEAQLTDNSGTHTLTIKTGTNFYIRGNDNFPITFANYSINQNSWTRYDRDYNQTVRGSLGGRVVNYGNLLTSQADGSAVGANTKTLATDESIDVEGTFSLTNGVKVQFNEVVTHYFAGNITIDDASIFSATNSTITLDAIDKNQTLQGNGATYIFNSLVIKNGGIPTKIRTVNIDANINLITIGANVGSFEATNVGGSAANYLIVDIDGNVIQSILPPGTSAFTLGENVKLYTSSATEFQVNFDVVNIDPLSTVRFDRAGNQDLPGGFDYGTIDLANSGFKTPVAAMTVKGEVNRVWGTPVFRTGTGLNHNVEGDWSMNLSSTTSSTTENDGKIIFSGADQTISSSHFNSVEFAGTGTKMSNGFFDIVNDFIISANVIVDADNQGIELGRDWNVTAGTFTQTIGTTKFNGTGIQNITTTASSEFGRMQIDGGVGRTFNANSDIAIALDFEFGSGKNAIFNLNGNTVSVKRNWYMRNGTVFNHGNGKVLFNGDTDQVIYNLSTSVNYFDIEFTGIGIKRAYSNVFDVDNNVVIASGTTFETSYPMEVFGDWDNQGTFIHYRTLTLDGNNQSVSASNFHDLHCAGTGTKTLGGSISLSGVLEIYNGVTLDVSASNYNISVDENWHNYGVFLPHQGTVTFIGAGAYIRSLNGASTDKQFYNIVSNLNSNSYLILDNDESVGSRLDVLNDLTINSGYFRFNRVYNHANRIDVYVGGSFNNAGGQLNYNNGAVPYSKVIFNATSGTHTIKMGDGNDERAIEIDAAGATYNLTGGIDMITNTSSLFDLKAGILNINGFSAKMGRGTNQMSGGTLNVNDGSIFAIYETATFTVTGGDFKLVSADPATPANMTVKGDAYYNFNMTGGTFHANNFTVSNTQGDGINLSGTAVIDGINDLDNGTFTNGTGNAYLTLDGVALGTKSAAGVVFNAGPTFNVSSQGATTGSIEFIVAGGTLAGAAFEDDDGAAATGNVRWTYVPGFNWIGAVSNDWHTAGNWSNTTGNGHTIPQSDDIVYIDSNNLSGLAFATANISAAAQAQRINIQGAGMELNLLAAGAVLDVTDNVTVFSGNTLTLTNGDNQVNVGGSWSNAGTFNEGTGTIEFNGTAGSHAITTNGSGDPFYNISINGNGATYTMGSRIDVANSMSITDGTLDASSGHDIYMYGDWSVNGGVFNAGNGRVYFDKAGNQSIEGGTFYELYIGNNAGDSGIKSVTSNIAVAGELRIHPGTIFDGLTNTIYIGGNWVNYVGPAGFTQTGTGTVNFNGATQYIGNLGLETIFNNISFQGTGGKYIRKDVTINGDMSIISTLVTVDIADGFTVTGAGTNNFYMTGGWLRLRGEDNFPKSFENIELTGGFTDYFRSDVQTITSTTYYNLYIRRLSDGAPVDKTLAGNIDVKGYLYLGRSDLDESVLRVAGNTITLTGNFYLRTLATVDWAGGKIIHNGTWWGIDPDFTTFNDMELRGAGQKRQYGNLTLTGDLLIADGVGLSMNDFTMTGAGGKAMTMEENTYLYSYTPAVSSAAFPVGFGTYTLHETSDTRLYGTADQTIYTTPEYGNLRIYTNGGNATLDGNLTVHGYLYGSENTTALLDGGFDMELNGKDNHIYKYTPTAGTTITMKGNQDQLLRTLLAAISPLTLENISFEGSGAKTLTTNNLGDNIIVNGDLTIASGVTTNVARKLSFFGANWVNNGMFDDTYHSSAYPIDFTGTVAQSVQPGANNDFYSVVFSNTTGTTVIGTDGFSIGYGDFTVTGITDFGNATHHIASSNFFTTTGTWTTDNANLIFDRNGTQYIPGLTAQDITIATGGRKELQGDWNIDDLTIDAGTYLDPKNLVNNKITLTGNWLNNGYFYRREGMVAFESNNTDAKTITPALSPFNNVTFNQTQTASRVYTLAADAGFYEDLTIGSGATLNLGGNILTLGNNDGDNPEEEQHVVQSGGTLAVDAGAVLQFNCSDDDNDNDDGFGGDYGARFTVDNGGTLSVVGTSGSAATITRSAGGNRIRMIVNGTLAARYYNIQYLTDEGFELTNTATLDVTNNFSDGTWFGLNQATGSHKKYYLKMDTDNIGGGADITINNITFNFDGTPNASWHVNIERDAALTNVVNVQGTISGLLAGEAYDEDTAIPELIVWDTPTDITWIGSVSIDWFDGANWSAGTVPTNAQNAIIPLGSPYNPTIAGSVDAEVNDLKLTTGILSLTDGLTLGVTNDMILGTGSGSPALLVKNSVSIIEVAGGWSTGNGAVFDHGDGTVVFNAPSATTASIDPNNIIFNNIIFDNGGTYNINNNRLDVDGDFTIIDGIVNPTVANYIFYVAGDFARNTTNGQFDNSTSGKVVLDGAAQLISNMTFHDLTVSGTDVKATTGNTTLEILVIENGSTLKGDGSIDINDRVTIDAGGVFNSSNQTHTFAGWLWTAGLNSHAGTGTVVFDRAGTQYIRHLGADPAEFHNLTFSGTASKQLGVTTGGIKYDGNVNVTGNVTINNSISVFYVWEYLLQSTNGTGTFTLDAGEYIDVRGADNFPKGFANYSLDPTSITRYYGTDNQIIAGGIAYGSVYLFYPNTKSLGGNVDIDGNLYIYNATLDVTASNFAINLAGRWYNNYAIEYGSFNARSGTVTFDGGNFQYIQIGAPGQNDFNNVTVNKSADEIRVYTNDILIKGNLNVVNGTFNGWDRTITIQNNMTASGTGQFKLVNANGVYYLNAPSGTKSIQTNGSVIRGKMIINAPTATYQLEDDLTVQDDFTLSAGTFTQNGHTANLGLWSNSVSISGQYEVSPGGILTLNYGVNLTVNTGGTIKVVGNAVNIATVTRTRTSGNYNFTVAGSIHAKYYSFGYMGTGGIYVNENGSIDAVNNFSEGTFTNGRYGGTYLRIENTQDITGAGRIENISFPVNPFGGATNVYKNTKTIGDIEIYNATGSFEGENFDEDPNEIITWTYPPELIWAGKVSDVWGDSDNWVLVNLNPAGRIPNLADNVRIPEPSSLTPTLPFILHQPKITVEAALGQTLIVETAAELTLVAADATNPIDLELAETLTLEPGSKFVLTGTNDKVSVGGDWLVNSGALFTAGVGSTVLMTAVSGSVNLDNSNKSFYNLEINATGNVQLADDLLVNNDIDIITGSFTLDNNDLTVGGDLTNASILNGNNSHVWLKPNSTTTKSFTPGTATFYDLSIGEAGTTVDYDLLGFDIAVDHNLVILTDATLNLNGNDLAVGNGIAIQKLSVAGSLILGANRTLKMGNNAFVNVENGGTFKVVGTLGNVATVTHNGSGYYNIDVQSGGSFEAEYYAFSYTKGNGIYLKSGANLITKNVNITDNPPADVGDEALAFSYGSFSNGTGASYITLANNLAPGSGGMGVIANEVTLNSGPLYNVSRTSGVNNINMWNYLGTFGGSTYEDDDGSSTTGFVRWFIEGLNEFVDTDTDNLWNNANNWTLGIIPTIDHRVSIVEGKTVILAATADGIAKNVTIQSGATIDIGSNFNLNVNGDFTIQPDDGTNGLATLTIQNGSASNIAVAGSWINAGTFNPGNSGTVTFTNPLGNVTIASGGQPFNNLTIDDSDGGIDGVVSNIDLLKVNNDLTVIDGTFSPSADVEVAGDWSIQNTGLFTANTSNIAFDGAAQSISVNTGAGNNCFYDVTFGGNIGSIKTLLTDICVDNDLVITRTLSTGIFNIDLKGDWNSTGTFNSAAALRLTGNTPQFITGFGTQQFYDLEINNSNAALLDITLGRNIEIQNAMTFTQGIVQTTDAELIRFLAGSSTTLSATSYVSGPVEKVGNTAFVYPIGKTTTYARLGISATPSIANKYMVEYFDGAPINSGTGFTTGLNHVTSIEYWDVNQVIGSETPFITLYWEDATRSGIADMTDLRVAHWTGATWENLGGAGIDAGSGTGSISATIKPGSLSPVTFGSVGGVNPLPVELVSFIAEELNGDVLLDWTTASEIDNDFFEIQRSENGKDFEAIGTVEGNGTVNELMNYDFTDTNPLFGVSYYRLRQVDFDGAFEYSRVVSVNVTGEDNQISASVYPNPTVTDDIRLSVRTTNTENKIKVKLYDMFGKVYMSEVYEPSYFSTDRKVIPNESLDSGLYIFIIEQAGQKFTKKVIVK